jgi:tRNA (cmo5U34)-methyltransferase
MVPGREEIEQTLLDLISAEPDEPFLGVEIGIGVGWLSAAVLREFSKARILGLDGSPEMLRMAAELLGHYGDRAELRRFRLDEHSWADGLPTARVFLCSLVFHHLDGSGKRDLFVRLLDRLESGGALLCSPT